MRAYQIQLLIIALILAPLGAGELATVSENQTVAITCSEQAQCIAMVNGTPVFFAGSNATTNLVVPFSLSYERNVTVTQNVSVWQNVTNLTVQSCNLSSLNLTPVFNVTTQVVNVTQCNASPVINVTADELAKSMLSSMNLSLVSSCREACTVPDLERQNLTLTATLCLAEINTTKLECEAEKQMIIAGYERDLNISRQETSSVKAYTVPWILLTILAVLAIVIVLLINYRNSRPAKIPSGATAAPIQEPEPGEDPEELDALDTHDLPVMRPKKQPMRGPARR